MGDIAIRTENLGKLYKIGEYRGNYETLRETIVNIFSAPFRHLCRNPRSKIQNPQSDTIWALKDIFFEVERGEVVGIIGRNGAGKTTLLKILSRITEPTKGWAEIQGRVGSLLEVGTGFHPQLTGRENIYLNGAILGMKKVELDRKFDEIVAFAEIEKFIDTPVKRYSSGMYVRLAFAVAAHLEPEILLVDEVLAVGDAVFQKRCLGKMGDVAKEGRTVLFVSHNMQAINSLCERAFLLDEGRIRVEGRTREVVERYLEDRLGHVAEVVWEFQDAPGNEVTKLRAVKVLNEKGEASYDQEMAQPITLEMEFWVLRPDCEINPSFHVYNQQGICLFAVSNLHDREWGSRSFETGLYRSTCRIPAHYLNEGQHQVSAFVVKGKAKPQARMEEIVSFFVHDYATMRGGFTGKWIGAVRPLLPWAMERIGDLP
jgi:lipopolysaccharide transport system ATP-binding protein